MNKAKKLCGIMMLIFILTFANTAFARANVCICGGHYNLVSTSYTVWSTTGNTRSCKHNHAYGNDYEQKRKKNANYKCSGCGNGYSSETYEYRWICKGMT